MKNNAKLALGLSLQVLGLALAEGIMYVPVSVLYLLDLLDWEYTWSMFIPVMPMVAGMICFALWFNRYKKKIRNMDMDFAFKNYNVPTNIVVTLAIQIAVGIVAELLAIGVFDPVIIVPLMPFTVLSCLGMVIPDILCFTICRPGAN